MINKIFFLFMFIVSVLACSNTAKDKGTPPQISNFRIKADQPDRIYFDSSIPIKGSNAIGFDLKDREGLKISNIFIDLGQKTGHYFSLSSNFKWYHNNTLNYNGESDIYSEEGVALRSFNLRYIKNDIPIPELTGKEYFVNLKGDDDNSGLSEKEAFRTIQKGVIQLRAGDKLWIKAGNYGDENINIRSGGTMLSPIFIEGYKDKVGDISSLYYKYGNENGKIKGSNPFLSDEMPYLYGNLRVEMNEEGKEVVKGGNAITMREGKSFVIIKNIQSENYEKGYVLNYNNSQILFENVMGKNMGVASSYGSIFYMDGYKKENDYLRLVNCVAINGSEDNFIIDGHNSLIENCRAYGDRGNTYGSIGLPTDYYYLIKGENNIVRNSKATRVSIGHGVHAFSLKYYAENTLVENCETINTQWSYQARYRAVHHNVFRNCVARANVPFRFIHETTAETGGIHVLNGAHHNVFENIYIHDTDVAFVFERVAEDGPDMGDNNIFKNIIIDNMRLYGVQLISWYDNESPTFNNNKFYNITFNNINGQLFHVHNRKGSIVMLNNEFKNCIFNNVNELSKSGNKSRVLGDSEFNWDTNNFFNSFPSQGSNALNVNPKFQNSSSGNFRLQLGSKCIDAGLILEEVNTDFDNMPRNNQGNSFDIGAYEYQN